MLEGIKLVGLVFGLIALMVCCLSFIGWIVVQVVENTFRAVGL